MTPQEREALERRKALLLRKRELLSQRADLVDEGGPSSVSFDTTRDAVEALPDWLTRTPFEKQNAHHRNVMAEEERRAPYQEALKEIPRGIMGPSWKDRPKERDIILERDGKTMTGGEAGLTRLLNSVALTIPQHLSKDWNDQVGRAGNEYPDVSMASDVAGFFLPGTGVFQGAKTGLGALKGVIDPGVKAFRGSGMLSRLGRFSPVVARDAAAGALDYATYEATVGAGTRAAEDGRQAGIGERVSAAGEALKDPWAYLGGAAPIANRVIRGGASLATGGKVSMTPPQRQAWASQVMQSSDPRSKAFQMVAKRLEKDGVTPEMLSKAVENYHYGGYSTVDEMLFEIAEAAKGGKGGGQLKQLAVALGAVGGDAQTAARTNFEARRLTSLERLRGDLRKAAGIEGSNFYSYGDELRKAQKTLPDYSAPYGKSITDASWTETVWPDLQTKPASQQAIVEAYGYARNLGELEVAGEIANLLPAIGYKIDNTGNVVKAGVGEAGAATVDSAGRTVPATPSTQALDYIDRMLGDEAQKLGNPATGGRKELARGPSEAQTSLRSIVDTETGLDQPRRVVHELKTADQALDFGRKSAAAGTDLETIQREFLREMQKYASDGAQVLGEETATINAALLMGWMRGAEDMISKASNPATAIRQLYGNSRQREKLVQMLMGLDDTKLAQQAGVKAKNVEKLSTGNSAETMRLRQVAGGKYGEQGTPRSRGRFDRERAMLNSENQIVGNSQTGQRNAAVEAQGGLQNRVNAAVNALFDPRQAARKLTLNTVGRAFVPGIFDDAINRELGEIMFTPGREHLQGVLRELDRLNPPRNAAPPATPVSGASPAVVPGGPTPAAAAAASQGILGNQKGAIYINDGNVVSAKRGGKASASDHLEAVGRNIQAQEASNAATAALPSERVAGPLPVLAAIGGAGTAGLVANNMLQPEASTNQVPPPRLEPPTSFGPSIKPNLSSVQKAVIERANLDARAQDQAQRQEYWEYLKSRGDGSSIEWNKIHQDRAADLALKPEDIARGVIRKRLPYIYDQPISVLSKAPVEELINGEWKSSQISR